MNFYDFSYPLANGQSYDFSQLKGKVVLPLSTQPQNAASHLNIKVSKPYTRNTKTKVSSS